MRQPVHSISSAPSRWSTERLVGVGFVGLLHVVAIYALVSGLAQKIVKAVPQDLTVTFMPEQQKPPAEKVVLKDLPKLPDAPQETAVPPPEFVIETPAAPPVTMPVAPPAAAAAADTQASSIANTHTTPPYPPMARKLGAQGTVRLRLTISAQGTVTAADVVQSSGVPELDRTAVAWVIAHWKYKPAVRGGVAVASSAIAAVVFNLRNAG
ncbi:MAG TPA: TonB family protein [Rhizomicrobium sp.]|jgi:protein TonB|nr:TonB family protein [Rhizomicrobium sp.]